MALSNVLAVLSIVDILSPFLVGFMKLLTGIKADGAFKKEAAVKQTKDTYEMLKAVAPEKVSAEWDQVEEHLTKPTGTIENLYSVIKSGREMIDVFAEDDNR